MKEKLKKYRKRKGFTYQEMAEKLQTSIENYKKLEDDYENVEDKSLKKRAILLLSSSSYTNLGGISPMLEGIDKANRRVNALIPSSHIRNMKIFESYAKPSPLKNSLLDNISNIASRSQFQDTATNSLAFISGSITSNYISKIAESASKATTMQEAIPSMFWVLDNNFMMRDKVSRPLDWVSMPMTDVVKKIREDVGRYDSFLNTSKMISKAILGNSVAASMLESVLVSKNFKKKNNTYNYFDFINASFYSEFADDEDYERKQEVLEELGNNPDFKEKSESIIKEIEDILNSEIESDAEEKQKSLIERFALWIKTYFKEDIITSNKVAQFILKDYKFLLQFVVPFLFYQLGQQNATRFNQKRSEETQKVGKEVDTIKNQIKNLKIVDPFPFMEATTDVNLRIRQRKNSKKIGVVRKGQKVRVLEKKIKWMKIVYDDAVTNDPLTGWVYMSYFK